MTSVKSIVKADENWVNKYWRPALGWSYIAICLFDFIIGPLVNYAFFKATGSTFDSWKPLTMTDGGMFHLSMGAVLGITSWTRGQEKINRRQPYYDMGEPNYNDEPRETAATYRDRVIASRETRPLSE